MTTNIDLLFKKIEKEAEKKMTAVIADSASLLFNNIVDLTPVDTGNLHRSYEVDYGKGFTKPRAGFENKITSIIDKQLYKLGNSITIKNSEDYAGFIEYGRSRQAPQGMMRLSLLKFNQFLNTAINKNKRI